MSQFLTSFADELTKLAQWGGGGGGGGAAWRTDDPYGGKARAKWEAEQRRKQKEYEAGGGVGSYTHPLPKPKPLTEEQKADVEKYGPYDENPRPPYKPPKPPTPWYRRPFGTKPPGRTGPGSPDWFKRELEANPWMKDPKAIAQYYGYRRGKQPTFGKDDPSDQEQVRRYQKALEYRQWKDRDTRIKAMKEKGLQLSPADQRYDELNTKWQKAHGSPASASRFGPAGYYARMNMMEQLQKEFPKEFGKYKPPKRELSSWEKMPRLGPAAAKKFNETEKAKAAARARAAAIEQAKRRHGPTGMRQALSPEAAKKLGLQ